MSGVVAQAPITVGDLLLGTLDDAGFDLQWETIEGWHSGAGVRLDLVQRPGTDGSFDARPTRDVRVVSITGWVRGVDRAATAAGIRRVVAAAASPDLVPLTVDDPDHGTLTAWVRPSAEPQVSWNTPLYAEFQLTYTAPDPTLYGPEVPRFLDFPAAAPGSGLQYPLAYPLDYGTTVGAGSQVFIPNPGTRPLWMRLQVHGPVPNPRVYVAETGSQLRLALTVPEGQWVDVLCRDRRVLANGKASRRFAASVVGDWLAIPPGGATVGWDADDYDPAARLWIWAAEGAWI